MDGRIQPGIKYQNKYLVSSMLKILFENPLPRHPPRNPNPTTRYSLYSCSCIRVCLLTKYLEVFASSIIF